jgi:hypothetical protein
MDGLNDAFVNFSDSDIINNIDIRHPASNDLDVGFNLNSILSNTSDSLDTPNLPIKQAPHPAPVQHNSVPTQAMNSEQNVRQQYAQHQQQVAHQQHQLAQQILAQQQAQQAHYAQQAHHAQQAQHVQHVQPKMMPKTMPKTMPKMQRKVMPHVQNVQHTQQIAPKVVPKLQPKVHFHDMNHDESGIINTRPNPNPPVTIKHDSPVQLTGGQIQDTQTQMSQTADAVDAVDANAADVGLDAPPIPDHMTSLMGYSIPTATLYFIFVMLLISFGIYYLTSPAKKPEPKKKKEEHEQDAEQE